MMSTLTKADLNNFRFDVCGVSERACQKLAYHTYCISGASGSDGSSGIDGINGINGVNGMSGSLGFFTGKGGDGSAGSNGKDGGHGDSGQFGTESKHALIWLNGTVRNLSIKMKTFKCTCESSAPIDQNLAQLMNEVTDIFDLSNSTEIILVKAVGGSGGDGGKGGRGGNGGNGGAGGRGGNGLAGQTPLIQGISGENGQPGGNGGHGGGGGNGGDGGRGGNGGNAGAGGHVQIRSTDPLLLMLVEVDCRTGEPGKGSSGGSGGVYGHGGSCGDGGSGGLGGFGGPGGLSGSNGRNGFPGGSGSNGSFGTPGSSGQRGRRANDGLIEYAIIDKDNKTVEISLCKYHASVISYNLIDENNDGIYEPNSDILITNVTWTNNGKMTLPNGSILSFPSTNYISSDIKDISLLASAAQNDVILDTHSFKCHINAVETVSTDQSFILPIQVISQITLLDRSFTGSQLSTNLTCQYPIQTTQIQIPTFLGPNEHATVTINFKNISTRSYGSCMNSAGSIEFIFSTHPLIKILPTTENDSLLDNSIRCKINDEILPQSTTSIHFQISLDENASNHLFEDLFWNVDLQLRDSSIEKHRNNIRILPLFQPNIHTDVLLVTNSQFNLQEYHVYQNLFQLFQYSSQIWDVERYGAFHHPEIQWLNTANLIIFIYSNLQSTFNVIRSQLLVQHMISSENSGFICIGPAETNEFDCVLFDYNNLQSINNKQRTNSEGTNHTWSGFGFRQPNAEKLKMMANEIREDYEKQHDYRFLYQVVYDHAIDTRSQCCMSVIYGKKYVYRSILNFQVGNRIIMMNGHPSLLNSNLPFNHQQTQTSITDDIHLNSQFGRLLCAMLFYQGLEKSHQIIRENRELARCTFILDSDKFNFNEIFVSLIMSLIEREYDRGSLQFQSSKQVVNQISIIIRTTNDHQNDWLDLLIQSFDEFIGYQFANACLCCGFTNKAKQRNILLELLNNLQSLSTNTIQKNKQLYQAVRILRLQRLTNLKFPAADKRENCTRHVTEIQVWKEEQKNKKGIIISTKEL